MSEASKDLVRRFYREAIVEEQWLYRWHLPEDTSGLERLVADIIGGEVDAIAVTYDAVALHRSADVQPGKSGSSTDLPSTSAT